MFNIQILITVSIIRAFTEEQLCVEQEAWLSMQGKSQNIESHSLKILY